MEPTNWSMADAHHRKKQHQRLNEKHIAPITALVDRLRMTCGNTVPYVDPDCGGTDAKILWYRLLSSDRTTELIHTPEPVRRRSPGGAYHTTTMLPGPNRS